jgi:hypothetical protein
MVDAIGADLQIAIQIAIDLRFARDGLGGGVVDVRRLRLARDEQPADSKEPQT